VRTRLVVAALLLGACSTSAPASQTRVELGEFHVSPAAPVLHDGEVTFDVRNDGEFPHTFVVTAEDGSIVAALDPIPPGGQVALSLDLPSGAYQLSCRIVVQLPDGSVVDHYQAGMHARITVTGDA
jgi:uncharacterized cupredoxin-like copper-binding protein